MYEYPFGNSQQLNLDWFLTEWKNLLAAWEAEKNGIEGALQAEIDRAEAALADVFTARDAAAQSATSAGNSADAAAQSATDASGYLATVRADANAARDAARNAAESAQTALASKNAAGQSERNAAQSEANANSSKDAAAQSAANALAHKDAAAQSAADANASKSAAAQSAEDAEAYAQEIPDLKNSINNGFRSIFPTMLLPANAMCRGSVFGATIVDGHIFGTIQAETNTTITGNENLLPSTEPTPTLPDDYFSIYLPVGNYAVHVECGYAEYAENARVAQLYFAEKTVRTPRGAAFSLNGALSPYTKLTANFNVTVAGWYLLRLYFDVTTPLNIKFWLTKQETSATAMLLENM